MFRLELELLASRAAWRSSTTTDPPGLSALYLVPSRESIPVQPSGSWTLVGNSGSSRLGVYKYAGVG